MLFCIFLHPNIQAQKYPFRNFSATEGLNSNQALSIFQNDDRLLWVGTMEGINFFDGIKFTSPDFLSEIRKKVIYDITKIDGEIFIGTSTGLYIWDNDSLRSVKDKMGNPLHYVYKSFKDSQGKVWIGTEKGLKVYANGIAITSRVNLLLASESVYNICETKPGELWFCTKTSGVFNFKNKRTKQYLNVFHPFSFVAGILSINDSTVWATTRNGLYSITPTKTERINTKFLPEDISFYDIKRSSNNDIWLTTIDGVLVYRNGKFKYLTDENGLIDKTILKVFEDKERTLWFLSTNKGLSQLINEKMVLWSSPYKNHKSVSKITKKNENEFLITNGHGASIYSKLENTYDTIPNLPHSIENEFLCSYYDEQNDVTFFGYNEGLITRNDQTYHQLKPKAEFYSLRKIFDIHQKDDGSFILATSNGIGQIINGEIQSFKSRENIEDYVLDINEGTDGNLYFGSDEGLLVMSSDEGLIHYSRKHNFKVGRIRQTTNDNEGNLWIASDEGLYKKVGDKITKINAINTNEVIQSLVFDNQNRLWAGLRTGFLQVTFNNEDTLTRFYAKSDGFLGNECNFSAIYCDEGKDIWFGTDKGLVIFRPEFDNDFKTPSSPQLNINVNGLADLNEYAELSPEGQIEKLDLPTHSNQIEFSFKIINLLAAKEIKFQYQLEGVDNEWIETTNDFKVIYSELSHGNYTFKLRVLDHPNLIPQEEIQTVKIFIKRPIYLQWWFIVLIIVIVGTWLYSYFLIRRNVSLLNRQKAIILKQKGLVEEKNREIVDSITYAKRIQDAILPNNSLLNSCFKEYFVFYKPRDIVSGDFYWVENIEDWVVFTAADCTGHGVPGAMVSLMCSNLLRKVILEEGELDPGKVLDKVTEQLLKRLQGDEEKVADGMDLTLCFWNPKTNQLKFSGAHNPLYLLRDGELQITKTNKQPIGYFEDKVDFITHEIELKKGDQIILFSDGYKDQFGGPKNKKFGGKRFNQMFTEIAHLPLEEQEEAILMKFREWKGTEEQVDDICILSIKV